MMLLIIFLISCCCFSTLNAKTTWKPENRIVNGYKGTAEQFPYQVGLMIDADDIRKKVNTCGGSLVGPKTILTAAHCFDSKHTGKASFGSDKYMKGITQKFSRASLHEKYNSSTDTNDIAIIHLDTPVTTNGKTIAIISLDYGSIPKNQNITISGFGLIGDDKESDQLFYAQEKVITDAECSDVYDLPPRVFCSQGYNKQQTCVGDSGGPAVKYDKSGKAIQIGVLSFAAESCEEGDPDVYTKVADFKDWIEKHWD